MSFRYSNKPIDVNEIPVMPYPTPKYALDNCFKLGKEAARNHYFGESTADLPYGIKSWSVYPYQIQRPAAFHCWMAGFYEQWSSLVNEHGAFVEDNKQQGLIWVERE